MVLEIRIHPLQSPLIFVSIAPDTTILLPLPMITVETGSREVGAG
jgi:hypothetical protein